MLHTSAVSQPAKGLESKETLQRHLDDVLEQYLTLLDRYQNLQQELSSNLSNGYLSLAQANFSNANRVRYGQDYYDDRMQATARYTLRESSPCFQIHELQEPLANLERTELKEEQSSSQTSDEAEVPSAAEIRSSTPCDPLKWFGFHVPPALRATQASFRSVVLENVPALVSLSAEMKEIEIEIMRTRKKLRKLGLMS